MKKRVISLLLAALTVPSIVLTCHATPMAMFSAESGTAMETEPTVRRDVAVYLEGEPADSLVLEEHDGTYYVTIGSFASLMDGEAMVEEENGAVTVTAYTAAEVVDVDGTLVDGVAEADVVEETLTLTATAGAKYIVANGRYLYVEQGTIQIDGQVAAPLRVLAQVYNLSVNYYTGARAAFLFREEGVSAYLTDGDDYYDEDELYWLSHIISAESGNQSLRGKIAVGNVVMNRVSSRKFPNSVRGVIFQKNQFSPAASGSVYNRPNAESIIAAKLVLEGAVVLKNALFFNVAGMNTYASRNRTYVTTIGAHSFYA